MEKEVYSRDNNEGNIDYRDEQNNRVCFSCKTDKNKKEKCEKISKFSSCLYLWRWIFIMDKNPHKGYKRGNDTNFIFFTVVSFSEAYFAHIFKREKVEVFCFDSMVCLISSYQKSEKEDSEKKWKKRNIHMNPEKWYRKKSFTKKKNGISNSSTKKKKTSLLSMSSDKRVC